MIAFLLIGGLGVLVVLALSGKAQAQTETTTTDTVTSSDPIASAQPDGGLDPELYMTPNWTNEITTDPATWPTGNRIWDICRAIAKAEGYDTNGAAFMLNNPGDLSPGDEHGYATVGPAEWHGGSYVIHFAAARDGWNACYQKVYNIVAGKSKVYGQNWTINQIGQTWAAKGQPGLNWAKNVAYYLGGLDPAQDGFDDYVGAV